MSNERHHSHRELLDCHTHSHEVNGLAIRSLTYEEWSGGVTIQEGQLYSIGLHPWSLPLAERLSDLIDQMRSLLASTPQIVAIGECGIDKVRSNASLAEQRTWLEAQMRLACQFHRPILLHTVRAWSETIEIRRELAQEFDQLPPMVLHGFRARGEVAQMMLNQGFALSFGRHYDSAALRLAYEANELLVETDDLPQGLTHQEALAEIYTRLAERVVATPFWQQVKRLGSLR